MNFQDTQIGQQVVRSKGDYVVGRIGEIVSKNEIKKRVQVSWKGNSKTWVSVFSVEPTSIPYEILPTEYNGITGRRISWPVYRKL